MSATITKARLAKLSKGVQSYIAEQDRLIDYWRDQVREVDDETQALADAATDLLAACREAYEFLDDRTDTYPEPCEDVPALSVMIALKFAIDKAKATTDTDASRPARQAERDEQMNDETKVLRPYGANDSAYHWVHLDNDGAPLCGDTEGKYIVEMRPEMWDGKVTICLDCALAQHRFSLNTLRAGQVRKYGPSEYIYDLTDLADEKRTRPEVLEFCQAHVKKSYLKEDMSSPFGPRMAGLTERVSEPGVWRYHVFCESTF